ncbi:MCE family protein [bacterium]|nr:MCE family protein [bacterium]
MATKRQTIEVGVFLSVMFVLLAIVLIYLAGLREETLYDYDITFTESVSGLSVGSKVTYRGVPVGKVTDLVVSKDNLIAVVIGVNPKKVTLRSGVIAKYSMETIFGPFTIDLFGGDEPDARPLDPGETIPVARSLLGGIEQEIPGTLVDVRKVVSKMREIIHAMDPEDLAELATKARALLDNANQGITDIRTEVKALSTTTSKTLTDAMAEIKKTREGLTPTLEKLQKATEKLNTLLDTTQGTFAENREVVRTTLAHIGQIAGKLHTQLDGIDVPAIVKTLKQTTKEVGTAAKQVGQAAADVGRASESIAQGRGELSRSVQNVERGLTRSLDELERALRTARALLEALERDPSAILRGKRAEPEG